MRLIVAAAAASLVLLAGGPGWALDPPKGPVVLTVSGAITRTNGPRGAEFDLEMLEALAGRTTRTHTPWTEGVVTFSGPLGRAVLDAVGATGETMRISALNDYAAEVPVADFHDHDVILATRMDGEVMSVRSRGPIFVIYPFDEDRDLYNEQIFTRSVWQVNRIEVR